MQKLFEALPFGYDKASVIVTGPNLYKEYEVKHYSPLKGNGVRKLLGVAYETDLEAACGTAIATAQYAEQHNAHT